MDVVKWLESSTGEAWSRRRHKPISFLLSLKDDEDTGSDGIVWFFWVADPGGKFTLEDVCA